MKKRTVFLVPPIILVLSVVIVLLLKMSYGTRLTHYKQYFLPVEGRVIECSGSPAKVRLFFYDEEEISELSSEDNILAISIITNEGEKIEVEGWEITEQESLLVNYAYRELKLLVKVTDAFEAEKLLIKYVDNVSEEFYLGKLEFCSMDTRLMAGWIPMMMVSGLNLSGKSGGIVNSQTNYVRAEVTALSLMVSTCLEYFDIIDIDLGIEGIDVVNNSVKEYDGSIYYEKFTHEPANEVYMNTDILESLPEQDNMNYRVLKREKGVMYYLMALRKTRNLKESLTSYYISPIYRCVDPRDRTEFLYACEDSMILTASVVSDAYMRELMESYGQ